MAVNTESLEALVRLKHLKQLAERVNSELAAIESGGVASHTHGNLTNDGKIGTASGYLITTGANGVLQAQTRAAAGVANASHPHGSITSAGNITATGVSIASGDALVIVDSSDGSAVKKTAITFDGETATKYLSQKGTWETPSLSVSVATDSAVNEMLAEVYGH